MHPEPMVTQVFQHIIPLVQQELQKLNDHLQWIDGDVMAQTASFARQTRQQTMMMGVETGRESPEA